MKPLELITLTQPDEVLDLQDYLKDKYYIAFDIETTGLTKQDEIIGISVCAEEDKAYYIIMAKWDVQTQSLIYDNKVKNLTDILIRKLRKKSLIMHNGIFDCSMVEAYFKISLIESLHTDTMILAHLLNENRRIGLKELAKEYFGESATEEQKLMKESIVANGGKCDAKNFELYKADPLLIAKYGAKDAWLTYKLFGALTTDLYRQELEKFFYEEESMPLLRGPTYDLNTTGLAVDQNKLMELKKTLEAETLQDMDFINNEIKAYVANKYPGTTKKNTFNINSNQQLAWLLHDQLSLEFNTLTDSGKAICNAFYRRLPYTRSAKNDFIALCLEHEGQTYTPDATVNGKLKKGKKVKAPWAYITVNIESLQKHAAKYKWIARFLQYKKKVKLLTTYVTPIQERMIYGIIQPQFLQAGTTSGRYSCKSPNFQNLPRDDERVKQCIVSRPGKVFVSADQSQLEPRIFAFMSQDELLKQAFDGKSDFYSVIGMRVYGKNDCTPQKEGPNAFGVKYKQLRDLSKVIALASTYGATARKLMKTTGKSLEQTQSDIDTYFEEFPKVKDMQLRYHEEAKHKGQVTNYFGRPRRMPEAKFVPKKLSHDELTYEQRNLLNLAVNHPIQSTGGSLMNRAAIAFYSNCKIAGIECKIVSQIHDELVAECDEQDAENISLLLQDAMENTVVLPGMPLEAIPRITKTLAKK